MKLLSKEETVSRFRSQSVLRALTLNLDLCMDNETTWNLLHGFARLIDALNLRAAPRGRISPYRPILAMACGWRKPLALDWGFRALMNRIP